jgi:myosin heavy subunit
MSSTPARKPPPPGSTGRNTTTSPGTSRTPARSSTPTNGTNGVQRTRSQRTNSGTPLSARASVRKPGTSSSLSQSTSRADDDGDDETAREEAAAYLNELKEKLQKAENEADEYKKQIGVLKARLDDSVRDQSKLEERVHEEEEKVEGLENEKRELTRKHRELESIYEAERVQSMKDKEASQTREDELQETIQRLKETLAMKDTRASIAEGDDPQPGQLSRTCKPNWIPTISELTYYSELPQ